MNQTPYYIYITNFIILLRNTGGIIVLGHEVCAVLRVFMIRNISKSAILIWLTLMQCFQLTAFYQERIPLLR